MAILLADGWHRGQYWVAFSGDNETFFARLTSAVPVIGPSALCNQVLDHVKLYQRLTTKENRFGCFRADWSPKPLAAKVVPAHRRG